MPSIRPAIASCLLPSSSLTFSRVRFISFIEYAKTTTGERAARVGRHVPLQDPTGPRQTRQLRAHPRLQAQDPQRAPVLWGGALRRCVIVTACTTTEMHFGESEVD